MIWQEDARLIIMVTKEVERGRVRTAYNNSHLNFHFQVKCFRYWPEPEEQKVCGVTQLVVKNIQVNFRIFRFI